jgi:hypothetical protein
MLVEINGLLIVLREAHGFPKVSNSMTCIVIDMKLLNSFESRAAAVAPSCTEIVQADAWDRGGRLQRSMCD